VPQVSAARLHKTWFLLTWNWHFLFVVLKNPLRSIEVKLPSSWQSHYTRFASSEEWLFPCLQKFGFYKYSSCFEGWGIGPPPPGTDINSFVMCYIQHKVCEWQDEWRLAHCPSNELLIKLFCSRNISACSIYDEELLFYLLYRVSPDFYQIDFQNGTLKTSCNFSDEH
jgi:hypothetical protein